MRRLLGCPLIITCATFLFAQASFGVASIKPSDPNMLGIRFRNEPGGINISGATISMLIQQAYDVRSFQIAGGPDWISSEQYDVIAKVGRSSTDDTQENTLDQRALMELHRERIRSLLAERCRLKIRCDRKELQAYIPRIRIRRLRGLNCRKGATPSGQTISC